MMRHTHGDEMTGRGPARGRLACGNLAHGFAAADEQAKRELRGGTKPNVAIVSAYNDMLSAHQPFESYPRSLKRAVIRAGGIAQFAGGVPAMCDGITQGRSGMQLSLYSRDVIALSVERDQFDYWFYKEAQMEKDFLILADDNDTPEEAAYLAQAFERVTELETIPVVRFGVTVFNFRILLAEGFRP